MKDGKWKNEEYPFLEAKSRVSRRREFREVMNAASFLR